MNRDSEKIAYVSSSIDIWTIPEKYHPSILALCLSHHELYRLTGLERGGGQCASCPAAMVMQLSKITVAQSSRSRGIQKLLNGKYQLDLQNFSQFGSDDELRAGWERCRGSGKSCGAYWATMSHQECSESLRDELWQHTTAASLQSCCRQARQDVWCEVLQRKLAKREHVLAETEQRHNGRIAWYCCQVARLKAELQQAEHKVARLERHLELFRCRDLSRESR